jgi:hypothetical protein
MQFKCCGTKTINCFMIKSIQEYYNFLTGFRLHKYFNHSHLSLIKSIPAVKVNSFNLT